MRYTAEIRIECRRMYVIEGKSSLQISKELNGRPTPQQVSNWAKETGRDGLTWKDERQQYEIERYESISPRSMANKILGKINTILDKPNADFDSKDADSLAKMRVNLEKITDPAYQIPVMYQLLTDLIEFLNLNYKHLATPEFINAVRHFKNQLRTRLIK